MKIHFMGALDGQISDYKKIIEIVKKHNHELLTDHVLTRSMEEIRNETPSEAELYVKRSHRWMKKADVIIFEVTKTDASIGYEIATTLNMMKPVIVLYNEEKGIIPHALKGMESDKLQVLGYTDRTLSELIPLALDYAQDTVDVRFNFFISPSIGNYLDWIAQNKKLPRSVYLRNLIEKDMAENEEYGA